MGSAAWKRNYLDFMFQLLGVKKTFSGREILAIDDISIDRGFHWVCGENGSGKTTLLKMLAGLIPFDGVVSLDGVSLKKNGLEYRRKVSWAEAEPIYPPFITGIELVALTRDTRQTTPQRVAGLIDRFAVSDYLNNPTGTYSSGMLKRLSLLLAFIGPVSFILLDEPLLTLDEGIAGILPELMRDTATEYGTGFLYSSHQPFPAPGFPAEHRWQMSGKTIIAQ